MAKVICSHQCRAARALIGWSQEDLADAAEVSRSTVKDFETLRHDIHRGTEVLLIGALHRAGVEFIDPDENAGPGVRLSKAVPDGC